MSSIYLYILTTCVEGLAATLIGLHGRTSRWSSRTTTASRGRPWRSAYPLLCGRSHAYSFAREPIERPEPNSTLGYSRAAPHSAPAGTLRYALSPCCLSPVWCPDKCKDLCSFRAPMSVTYSCSGRSSGSTPRSMPVSIYLDLYA